MSHQQAHVIFEYDFMLIINLKQSYYYLFADRKDREEVNQVH